MIDVLLNREFVYAAFEFKNPRAKAIIHMDEPTFHSELRPPDRRWMIFGILFGGALGYLPVYFPQPFDRFALCCFGGALCGLIFPLKFAEVLKEETRFFIRLCIGGVALGAILGFVIACTDEPLPEYAAAASASFGTVTGAIMTEMLLKRAEARYKQLLEAEEELYS